MSRRALCIFAVLLAIPGFASITNVQSNGAWTCSGTGTTVTCQVTLTTQHTTTGNLLAVWTFWQTNFPYIASVSDSPTFPNNNTFVSAVGPTIQPNTGSTPTTGQVFYAANIHGTLPGTNDVLTVKFTCPSSCSSPSISEAGVVAVEYSGLDQSNPLDSVSAGYSISAGSFLDSGNVAPANSNLLVFGAGVSDGTSGLAAGNGFTSIQSDCTTSLGSGIVEDNSSPITGNNVLQRATASFGTTCSGGTTSGNWLMQMAVFRDASWSVQGGWSSTRPAQIRFADQFPGSTADAKINAAVASLNGNGGIVDARGLTGAQNIVNTVAIPQQTVVRLAANTIYTCNVASAPCWKLTGPGAKLIGGTEGISIGTYSPSTQIGTILRMCTGSGCGITSTTDMVAINCGTGTGACPSPAQYAGNGGFEVGNLTIDFAQSLPSSYTGRYCIAAYAINHSWIHDIACYNPGVNGMEFETTTNGWAYDDKLANVLVQAAGGTGFNWTTVTGSGFADFDRWSCDRCKYSPGTISSGTTYYTGVNGFALTTAAGSADYYQGVADFFFTNLWTGGTGGNTSADWAMNHAYPSWSVIKPMSGNAGHYYFETYSACTSGSSEPSWLQIVGGSTSDGSCTWVNAGSANYQSGFYMVQQGTGLSPYIENIFVQGEIEQQSGCACGTAINVSNAGPANAVQYLTFNVINENTGFWGSVSNLTGSNAAVWSLQNQVQGITIPVTTVPSSPTQYPYQGFDFQTSNGDYEWIPTSDAIVHVVRTDPMTGPTQQILFDQSNARIGPGVNQTTPGASNCQYCLGWPGAVWSQVNAVAGNFSQLNNLIFSTAPTILSGFGAGASITNSNGTAAFTINVGTSNTGTGVMTLPTAAHGWACHADDVTTVSANVFHTRVIPTSTTSVTFQNYTDTAGTNAWVDDDVLVASCFAY